MRLASGDANALDPAARCGCGGRAVRGRRRILRRGPKRRCRGCGRGGRGCHSFGICRRRHGCRCFLRLIIIQSLFIFAFFQNQRDDLVDLYGLRPVRHQYPGQRALVDGFDFHCRLVGFDFGDDLTRLDLVALFLTHLARLPSVIVGERAGISISIGMAFSHMFQNGVGALFGG